MTIQESNGSGIQHEPATPLTQANIPALVQAVTTALKEKLKEKHPLHLPTMMLTKQRKIYTDGRLLLM